jgi:hypothetical protein
MAKWDTREDFGLYIHVQNYVYTSITVQKIS